MKQERQQELEHSFTLLEGFFPPKLQYIFHNCFMKNTLSLADSFTDDPLPL